MVVAYLANAECQYENDAQRAEIRRAFHDALTATAVGIRMNRYKDYAGAAHTWSIVDLLRHYCTPDPPIHLDPDRFYRDLREPSAHAAIQHQLDALSRLAR